MAQHQPIVPAGSEKTYDRFHFAPAARVGDTVHVSGVIGTGPDGACDPNAEVQFDHAFTNLAQVLEASGGSLGSVVEMTSFHVGLMEHMRTFMAAKDKHLSEPWPAWTAIGCTELAMPGGLVEIRVTAHIPQ